MQTLVSTFIRLDILYRDEKELDSSSLRTELLRRELEKILITGLSKFGDDFWKTLKHNRRGYRNGYNLLHAE